MNACMGELAGEGYGFPYEQSFSLELHLLGISKGS